MNQPNAQPGASLTTALSLREVKMSDRAGTAARSSTLRRSHPTERSSS